MSKKNIAPKTEIPKGVPMSRPDEPKPKSNNLPKYETPPPPPPPKNK